MHADKQVPLEPEDNPYAVQTHSRFDTRVNACRMHGDCPITNEYVDSWYHYRDDNENKHIKNWYKQTENCCQLQISLLKMWLSTGQFILLALQATHISWPGK